MNESIPMLVMEPRRPGIQFPLLHCIPYWKTGYGEPNLLDIQIKTQLSSFSVSSLIGFFSHIYQNWEQGTYVEQGELGVGSVFRPQCSPFSFQSSKRNEVQSDVLGVGSLFLD